MAKLNPVTQLPNTARDLTKDYIMGYIKAHGTAEDKAWYVALVSTTPKVKKINNLTKQEYETDDMKTIREKVIEKFFLHLKKKDKEENKLSYEEQLKKEFGL